jgi:hypothetical protein
MTDSELWPKLAQHWRESHNSARVGVTASAIAEFEQRYRVVLPKDVRAYFEAMDGQCEKMGTDWFGFWPLSKVKLVSEELSDIHLDRLDFPNCFLFADYLCWSWAYAVEMGESSDVGGTVYCIAGVGHNRQMAPSFVEFIRAYVTDPMSVTV